MKWTSIFKSFCTGREDCSTRAKTSVIQLTGNNGVFGEQFELIIRIE